jgi:AcrR family transcriptional regulator
VSISSERSTVAVASKAGRSRDAAASRESLLQAARELFGQRGFEGTTLRDIGERAGVDAALIARYFGSKAELYIAAVAADDPGGEPYPGGFDGLAQMVDTVVSRAGGHGPGLILQAFVRGDVPDEIRVAALQRVRRRLVDPLVTDMARRGVPSSELRAEVAVAALVGVRLARSLGWFEEIRSVPKEELVTIVTEALCSLTDDPRHS